MFRIARRGMFPLVLLGLAAPSFGQGALPPQGTPTQGTAPRPTAPQPTAPPAVPGADEALGIVNTHGKTLKVTKGAVVRLIRNYAIPPGEDPDLVYHQAVNQLANTELLNAFLARQLVRVSPEKIDEQLGQLKQQIKAQGQDLPTVLLQNGSSMDELREQIANRIRWTEYYKAQGNDATLRRFLNENHDRFSGTQVRASHILLKVPSDATAQQKEQIRQKLVAVRNDVLQNKLTFAEAANKYSEDPANAGGAGGDLDYFTLDSGFIEEFAEPAFQLKKGEISQPVETPFGYHLIQVTDRKEGKLPEFEQNKPYILDAYAADLQKKIVMAERKAAKIEIKPMPEDIFPAAPAQPQPAATAAPAPAPGAATGASTVDKP